MNKPIRRVISYDRSVESKRAADTALAKASLILFLVAVPATFMLIAAGHFTARAAFIPFASGCVPALVDIFLRRGSALCEVALCLNGIGLFFSLVAVGFLVFH